MTTTPDFPLAILGTGFAGLGLAIKLKQQGESDFVVLERGEDVGGTWRDNTYPGCQCDIPSHLYSFSFAPDHRWSRRFAPQADILRYLQRVAGEILRDDRANLAVVGPYRKQARFERLIS